MLTLPRHLDLNKQLMIVWWTKHCFFISTIWFSYPVNSVTWCGKRDSTDTIKLSTETWENYLGTTNDIPQVSLKVIDDEIDEVSRKQHSGRDTDLGRQAFSLKTCIEDLSGKEWRNTCYCRSQGQGDGLHNSIPERMWFFMTLDVSSLKQFTVLWLPKL